MSKKLRLSGQSRQGLRHSPMCETVYDDGSFDYRLYPTSDNLDIQEASAAMLRKGCPLMGHVDTKGNIAN